MARITAIPKKRVGHIEFGVSREEVCAAVGLPCETFMKSLFDDVPTDDFGAFHVYYDAQDRCEAVEVFPEFEVEVNGRLIFPTSLDEAMKALPSLKRDDDGLISVEDSVGVYAPYGAMESILFGIKGYLA